MIVRYYLLTSRLRLDLYSGRAAAAWRGLQDDWPWLARTGLLRLPFFAVEAHHLRATIAVAALRDGALDRKLPTALRRSLRYLERQPAAWPRALAGLSRAGLLAAQCDMPAAIDLYRVAHERLTGAEMPLYAAAARRRLGELLGDDQLITQADAEFLDRGVANSPRFAALLAGT
jgi:hypothetical protein